MNETHDLYAAYAGETPLAGMELPAATASVSALRAELLGRRVRRFFTDAWELAYWRSYRGLGRLVNQEERHALARAEALRQAPLRLGAADCLAGRFDPVPLSEAEVAELETFRAYPLRTPPLGQAAHMSVDYDRLLAEGLRGVRSEARERLAACDPLEGEGVTRAAFYRSCIAALDGVRDLQYRLQELATARAERAAGPERARCLRMARALARVPEEPATTFFEAVQAVHLLTLCLGEGLYQYGRPDRYLLPFYRRDLALGILDPAAAQEIVDHLCLLQNDYVPESLAAGLMVGGTTPVGQVVCNELTYLFLNSILHTRMAYPGVGLCVAGELPEAALELAARCLGEGLSHPALFNDAVIREGLCRLGVPERDNAAYIHSTCVEITPCSASAAWVASPYHNLPGMLLTALTEEPATFDGLIAAFRAVLRREIREKLAAENEAQHQRSLPGGEPLVSCFVRDCLERGRDVARGGARYNWIMPSFVGLSNLADSLVAVERLVYREERLSPGELLAILKADFSGQEPLRQELLNRYPKYGNQAPEPDEWVRRVAGWIAEECACCRTFRGAKVVPSLFCWIMHERLGSETMATPDGRRRGFPLGDGSGPAQGRERRGPTASILSSTCWDHSPFIGGIAVNLKVQKSLFDGEARRKLLDLIRTYMERGGFELQVNAVDRETLLRAREEPDRYRDLVVRIGGYSDYFVRLPPQMQEELILRTEHAL